MSDEAVTKAVTQFYDSHPINEDQILHALRESGVNLTNLTQDDLTALDQDHYGGIEANALLSRKAGITPSHHVLDVCSGMGGPACWLAQKIGCRVTGLELTQSRCQAANRLTAMVGLDEKVEFRCGNAVAIPLADGAFDVAVSQEAFVHARRQAAEAVPESVTARADERGRRARRSRRCSAMSSPSTIPRTTASARKRPE